jgi:uncharacterized protein with FMN-binding domain
LQLKAIAALLFAAGCSSGNRGFWNEIELVEVAGAGIQKIEILEHRNLLGKKAEREIPSRVLTAQSLQVDTVTRATASSMVILKAIEIALSR